MKKLFFMVLATLSLGLSLNAFAAEAPKADGPIKGDAAAGAQKSAVCAACHGADGNSVIATNPKLAGQHEAYLHKQLKEFKSGERANPIMAGQVAALSEQDMADLAAYFSSKQKQGGAAAGDEETLTLGERLYRGGNLSSNIAACSACHGPTGAGNPASKFPAISGQHAAYTKTQLETFRNGSRSNNSMMMDIAKRLTDKEIEAVSQYIAGLK